LIDAISSILVLYAWIVAAALIVFLYLISRLFEIRFQKRSYYQLMIAPLVILVVAAFCDAFLANSETGNPLVDFVGPWWIDLLWLIGGFALILLGYSLYRMMMGGRR
jgi:hypothetical protein